MRELRDGPIVRKMVLGGTVFIRLGDVWHNADMVVKVTNSVVVFSDGTRVPHNSPTGAAFLEEVGGIERLYG